ncbi:MAG: hypothetical protein QXL53_01780, partial [Acidilobaceae archaeon]
TRVQIPAAALQNTIKTPYHYATHFYIERRKRNARTPWKIIHSKFSEKKLTVKVPPYNTSRTCL